MPPLVDQFPSPGGNLGDVWSFFASDHESGPSVVDSARIVAPQFGIDPPWITGDDAINPISGGLDPDWTAPVLLLLVASAVFVYATA